MREFHVLNLGAGVQSTTLYLLFAEGKILNGDRPVALDAAIFADTLVQIEFQPKDDPRAKQLPMNFNKECMGECGV